MTGALLGRLFTQGVVCTIAGPLNIILARSKYAAPPSWFVLGLIHGLLPGLPLISIFTTSLFERQRWFGDSGKYTLQMITSPPCKPSTKWRGKMCLGVNCLFCSKCASCRNSMSSSTVIGSCRLGSIPPQWLVSTSMSHFDREAAK